MHTAQQWDERYVDCDLPWDNGKPDRNLIRVIEEFSIAPCKAVEMGCGTGTNAIWLAQQGFTVTAFDLAATAIRMAKEKAAAAGVSVSFRTLDILQKSIAGNDHLFAFDRGCFHSLDEHEQRVEYVQTIYSCLSDGGLWVSLIGSKDGKEREVGPPRLSCTEIVAATEPKFEILQLTATVFNEEAPASPEAWACLMRKRASAMTSPQPAAVDTRRT